MLQKLKKYNDFEEFGTDLTTIYYKSQSNHTTTFTHICYLIIIALHYFSIFGAQ